MGSKHRIPDFIGIGTAKSGTTWIDRNLRIHPQVWMPCIKEIQYFSERHLGQVEKWAGEHRHRLTRKMLEQPDHPNYQQASHIARTSAVDDDWYLRIFDYSPPGLICGEISPVYCMIDEVGIRHIERINPQMRYLLAFRDPVERAWSNVRMIAGIKQRQTPDDYYQLALKSDAISRSRYDQILIRWEAQVDSERLHICFFDDIRDQPNNVLHDLCRFLGIDPEMIKVGESGKVINPGLNRDIPVDIKEHFREKLRPVYDYMYGRFPALEAKWGGIG